MACGSDGGGFFTQYAVAAGAGSIVLHHRGKRYAFSDRYVVLVDAGDFVPIFACDDIVFQTWCFAPDFLRQEAEERGNSRSPSFVWCIGQDDRLHSAIVSGASTLARTRDALEQQEAMATLLDVLLCNYLEQTRSSADAIAHRAVRRMRDLIHDAYDRQLTLDLLAEHAHLNKFYALRAFKRALGVTPHEYQRHLRLSKSCEMLRTGRRCAEIAHTLGFCDESHYVRSFRQANFITPHQYRIAA